MHHFYVFMYQLKKYFKLGVVVLTIIPAKWEAKAGPGQK
jgi:hypothetical protein